MAITVIARSPARPPGTLTRVHRITRSLQRIATGHTVNESQRFEHDAPVRDIAAFRQQRQRAGGKAGSGGLQEIAAIKPVAFLRVRRLRCCPMASLLPVLFRFIACRT